MNTPSATNLFTDNINRTRRILAGAGASAFVFCLLAISAGLQLAYGEQVAFYSEVVDAACSGIALLHLISWRSNREDPTLEPIGLVVLHLPPWAFIVKWLGLPGTGLSILLILRLTLWRRFVKILLNYYRGIRLSRAGKMALIGSTVLIVVHWLACIWLYIRPINEAALTAYNLSVYWVVTTLTTVGYGDITPVTNLERVFTIFVMVLGVGMYGLVIGQVSTLMLNSDRRQKKTIAQLELLDSFCRHYRVPEALRRESLQFYEHVLSQDVDEDERAMLAGLPDTLKSALEIYMNQKPLMQVSLFQDCSTKCLLATSSSLTKSYVGPNEEIITQDEVGDEMYLLGHGIVEVVANGHHITYLRDGSCFGEMALVLKEPRSATIRTQTHCEVLTLSKEAFDGLVNEHPDLKRNVESLVRKRRESLDSGQ